MSLSYLKERKLKNLFSIPNSSKKNFFVVCFADDTMAEDIGVEKFFGKDIQFPQHPSFIINFFTLSMNELKNRDRIGL